MSSKVNAEQKKLSGKSTIIIDVKEDDDAFNASTSKSTTVNTGVSTTTPELKTQDMCIAEGCYNIAIQHAEWDNEYCSVSCTYKHCKATFIAWLENNKTAKAKEVPASVTEVNAVVNEEKEESETSSTTT